MRSTALILGGSHWQRDLIKSASAMHLRTLVTDISADAPGRFDADEFIQIDTNDRQGLLRIARDRQIAIVLADQTDRIVPVAAFLNEQLGLNGIRPDTARVFTDKLAMRDALAGSDIKMPRYAEVATIDEALRAAVKWGYPSILKPKTSQSSFGVFKVENERQLRQQFAGSLKESRDGKILLEEFVEGPEVTVEGLSLGGTYHVLATSEKEHYSFNRCVAKRLAYPPRFDQDVLTRIRGSAERVINLLGLKEGLSHGEFRIAGGLPYLIEVAARGGGTGIASVIVPHVSGIDAYQALINRLLGKKVKLRKRLNRAANLEFFDFRPGKVKAIRGLDEVRELDLVRDIGLHFRVDDTIRAATNDKTRSGFFISLGETRDEIDEKSRRVRELVIVDYW
jgi:carbamoyl-phosphate synthase large subunit